MRKQIGTMKAKRADGSDLSLNIFQEFETYIPKDRPTGPAEYLPTFKSADTQDGQPVNFEPDTMQAQIVQTGELLQVDEVSYIV